MARKRCQAGREELIWNSKFSTNFEARRWSHYVQKANCDELWHAQRA